MSYLHYLKRNKKEIILKRAEGLLARRNAQCLESGRRILLGGAVILRPIRFHLEFGFQFNSLACT